VDATKQRLVPTERQRLFGLTIAIGGVCGLAAVAFHLAIEATAARTIERAMAATGYTWIAWTILTPTLGGVLSGLLLYYVVPNARGSGIPQIKIAYASNAGRLRLRDSLGKFAVGVLQIGSGSSLGREGPPCRSAPAWRPAWPGSPASRSANLKRLIPVGAAAGIAAAFQRADRRGHIHDRRDRRHARSDLVVSVIVAAALAAVVEAHRARRPPGVRPPADVSASTRRRRSCCTRCSASPARWSR